MTDPWKFDSTPGYTRLTTGYEHGRREGGQALGLLVVIEITLLALLCALL
jgi:hypothetical protein